MLVSQLKPRDFPRLRPARPPQLGLWLAREACCRGFQAPQRLTQCCPTIPSSGQTTGFALRLPLMSNVEHHETPVKIGGVSWEQIRSRRLPAKNFLRAEPDASSQCKSANQGALRRHLLRAAPAGSQCWRLCASKWSVNEGLGHPAATCAILSSPCGRRAFASRETLAVSGYASGRQSLRGALLQVSAIAFGAGSSKCWSVS